MELRHFHESEFHGGSNHLESSYQQAEGKALAGPCPRPAGHEDTRTRPGQGAPDRPLGKLSIEVTPPHEIIVSKRKDSYTYRYGYYGLLAQWEADIKAELEAIVRGVKATPESFGDVAVRLSELSEELALVNHTSRWCMRSVIPSEGRTGSGKKYKTGAPGQAEIHTGYKGDGHTAHWVYVRACGSPFFCIGCAQKIYAVRRSELTRLFEYCREKGHAFFFGTFTHPHTNRQTLQETMAALAIIRRKLRAGNPWKRFKEKYGIFGAVVTLEVTYSDFFGWHPHFHMAFAAARPGFTEEESAAIQQFLTERWNNLCVKYGLITDEVKRQEHLLHGVRVQIGTDEAQLAYLAKTEVWEMASTTTKTPKRTASITPWEISRRAQAGDPKYKALWFDFMRAMKGRVAVQWSHGLKALVGVQDVEDQDIAQGKEAVKVYSVSKADFARVCHRRAHCEILEKVEDELSGGSPAVEQTQKDHGVTLITPEEDRQMKLYQIDATIDLLQTKIEWIQDQLQESIPAAAKLRFIQEREELEDEISYLLEAKTMLQ